MARGGDKKLYSSFIINVAIENIAFGLVLRGLIKIGKAKEVAHYVYEVV